MYIYMYNKDNKVKKHFVQHYYLLIKLIKINKKIIF